MGQTPLGILKGKQMKTGKLGKYSWVIDENEWTTLYIGSPDPSNSNTIFDGFVTCDPEEAILKSIIKAETTKNK
jgi:hypothetical protein